VDIEENTRKGSVTVCYSRLESPVEAHVECVLGILAIHAEVQSATRSVRLNLSDHRQVTSPVILVPPGLGGPATIYYQALRGPRPIPVSLTELAGDGRPLGVMRAPRVVECTRQLVHLKPAQARVLARVRAPGGALLSFTYQPYSILGNRGYGIKVMLGRPVAKVVGFGALRIAAPLEYEVKRICGSDPYTLVYGILAVPHDRVFVHASGIQLLREVPIPVTVRPHSMLVYGFENASPSALVVRRSDRTAVVDQGLETILAETPCS
jgi:hypothetical protein